MRILRSILVALILVTFVIPVYAATLLPGTYKMEWRVPEPRDEFYSWLPVLLDSDYNPTQCQVLLEKVNTDRSITGLKSANALCGSEGGLDVFVDESKGTGTGYDVVYVLPKAVNGQVSDMQKAAKMETARREDLDYDNNAIYGIKEDADDVMTDMRIGGDKSNVLKPVMIAQVVLYINKKPTDETEKGSVSLMLGGGWFGSIKTDTGSIYIKLEDGTENGTYNDLYSHDSGQDGYYPGDNISVKNGGRIEVGEVSVCDGKPYIIRVSKLGDTVTVKPYKGVTGKLHFVPMDGYGKPGELDSASVDGTFTKSDLSWKASDVTLPVGSYDLDVIIVSKKKSKDFETGVDIAVEKPAHIKAGKTATVKVGGPVKTIIGSGSKIITTKSGSAKNISVKFTAGTDEVRYFYNQQKPMTVKIIDSAGKLIAQPDVKLKEAFSLDSRYIPIPATLKPGTYKLIFYFDPRPYQAPIRIEKVLKVR